MTLRNLVDLHIWQAQRLGSKPALKWKEHGVYHHISWHQFREMALACASALIDVGMQFGDRVGLLAENSVDWLITDMGLLTAATVNVPPHAPLTAAEIRYQLADADVRWLFVSNLDQLAKVQAIRKDLPNLVGIVVFRGKVQGDNVFSWQGFLQRGRQTWNKNKDEVERRRESLQEGSLATIMYTSGTTGQPKGVMLTHGNLLSNALAIRDICAYEPDGLVLTWLPFSHIYARTSDYYGNLCTGTTVCVATSADTVVSQLSELNPTHLSSVPRLYEKVLAAVASDNPETTHSRLRSIFGPKIRWLGSGGAPLPVHVGQTLVDAGLPIYPGYGLTESSPVISTNYEGHRKIDTVGPAIPGVEIRIAEDGEICTRGPHVMAGYWKQPDATAAAITPDGWLKTGDLGEIDADGYLKITGRKKELMVLSNGKKIIPSYIEGLLSVDNSIERVAIYGEGKNFLSALVVPNWPELRRLLELENITETNKDNATLALEPKVISYMQERMDRALQDIANYQRVKKIILLPEPFSPATGELTVSLKLRREVVFTKHKEKLEELYK